jgi:uncharacterized protein (TIGR00299 family) protein
MNTLYIDAFSGISGDMAVAAFLSLGLPLPRLQDDLSKVPLAGYTIAVTSQLVNGLTATRFTVQVAAPGQAHRTFRDIRAMLDGSALHDAVKHRAIDIFTRLAGAEARVHGVPADDVQFHEVGAVDSIVDIVGAALGATFFGIERTYVSALPLGSGVVQSQHGPLPVPAPATVELLRGFTTRPGDGEGELVTPTGAAIIASLASAGHAPDMRIAAVGYGAGQRTLPDRPNVLRLLLGEVAARTVTGGTDSDAQIIIETNIDDYNPEFYEYVMERLFAAGARDVYFAPLHMKKNRPGLLLSVLCAEPDRERLAAIVLNETSALGVRYYPVRRVVLSRSTKEVATQYGTVRVKFARTPDGHENVAPEYEDCKRLASEKNVPIKLVYQAALAAAMAGGE